MAHTWSQSIIDAVLVTGLPAGCELVDSGATELAAALAMSGQLSSLEVPGELPICTLLKALSSPVM